jgi:predicted ATPase/DNA-binding SARP family transcriptional activator
VVGSVVRSVVRRPERATIVCNDEEFRVRYGILGPFLLVGADGEARTSAAREREVLALLALHAGEVVTRERLIDALWGEQLPANPGNALQQRVVHVRRLLDDAGELETAPGGYRLAVVPDAVDAGRFERLRAAGAAALQAGDHAGASASLAAALGQWRGEALQDVGAPWATTAARRLEEARSAALEDRIDADLALGRHAAIVGELEALTAEHPLRERLRGQLMLALALSGRQAEALEVFARTRALLAEELGLDPSPALRQIHEDVLAHRLPAVARPRGTSGDAAPSGSGSPGAASSDGSEEGDGPPRRDEGRLVRLPAPTSSFVGRESELARLTSLMAADRIVTVTGPGGAGKTRLAVEAARARAVDARAVDARGVNARGDDARGDDAEVDGDVVFVGLATVEDPAAVPAVVAGAVGVTGGAGVPISEVLAAALTGRPVRLLLDNCEHLVEPVADLVTHLTTSCPYLRVLATSREPLGVDGEVVWPLDTLPVPPEGTTDLEVARRAAAVELLLERVRAVVPDHRPCDDEVPAIIRIVRELDGLPLAIELAAARTRAMSLAEIAERLADRFALLSGGRRGSPARHQALAATLAWSWELLDPSEQRAWMAAAVPAQDLTVDLLAPLLAAIDPDLDPVDAITGLCDRSLLRVEERGNPTRYQMLSTLKEFGRQRLADTGAEPAVRSAYADAVEAVVVGADRTTAERWDVDLDVQLAWLPDVRAAMRWRRAQGDRRGMQRLAAGLGWLSYLTALMAEGRRLLDLALGPFDEVDPADVEPYAVLWAAALRIADTDTDGPRWAELAAELADDEVSRSLAKEFVALYQVLAGDVPTVLATIEREAGVGGWLEGMWRLFEGKLLVVLGRLDAAEHAVEHAERLLREGGFRSSMLVGDVTVLLAQLRGDAARVRAVAERAIRTCQEHHAVELEAELRCMLAMTEAAVGDHEAALAQVVRARELTERAGPAMSAAMLAQTEGYLRLRRGDHAGARVEFERALELHPWVGMAHGRPFVLWALAHVALAEGDVARAAERSTEALADALERSDLDGVACALEVAAAVALARDQLAAAARLLGAAGGRRSSMEAPAPLISADLADATRVAVRERLGEERFAVEQEAGATMGLEELVPSSPVPR